MTQMDMPDEKTLTVEFYPSIDDLVYVALQIGKSYRSRTSSTVALQFLLALNAIGFPAFLIFSEQVLAGALIFFVNVVIFVFAGPRANSDNLREYYQHIYPDREKVIATVRLSEEGITYTADEGSSFWPWKRLKGIEDTTDALFFYFDGHGFGVRKSGFAYKDEESRFIAFANQLAQRHGAVGLMS